MNYYTRPFPPDGLQTVELADADLRDAWCRYFGVFSDSLVEATGRVGHSLPAVRADLCRPRPIRRTTAFSPPSIGHATRMP